MSVLETFYILFKSDADKAAEGLKKVDNSADKAEASLKAADRATKGTARSAQEAAAATSKLAVATSAADANARRLSASFLGMAKAIAGPLLGLLSAGSIFEIATGRAAEIRELDQFSAKLNSSIGDVDAFKRAVQGMGGDGARALDSLVKIGEKFNEAFSDSESGARKDFTEWGLAFRDAKGNALGATDAMLMLAGSIENVSRAEALARIKKLGIEDPASIELILKGRKEVERYIQAQKDLGVVTEAQAETTRKYYSAMGELGNKLGSVGNRIAEAVLPALTSSLEIMSRLVDWVGKNQHLVEGFFIGVAGAITTWLLPAMIRLAIATVAATWPYLLLAVAIGAIGVAFALAYEDFKAWSEGQPSVLGNLLGNYDEFWSKMQGWVDAFSFDGFIQDLRTISALLTTIMGLLPGVGGIIAPTTPYTGGNDPKAAAAYLETLKPSGGSSTPLQPWLTQGATSDQMMEQARRMGSGANYGTGLGAGQSALNGASNAPQSLAVPGTTNNTSNVSVGTVVVNTQATDAQGMAAAARTALQNELRTTSSGLDDGVDR